MPVYKWRIVLIPSPFTVVTGEAGMVLLRDGAQFFSRQAAVYMAKFWLASLNFPSVFPPHFKVLIVIEEVVV